MVLVAFFSALMFGSLTGGPSLAIPLLVILFLPLAVPLIVAVVASWRGRNFDAKDMALFGASLTLAAPFLIPPHLVDQPMFLLLALLLIGSVVYSIVLLRRLFANREKSGGKGWGKRLVLVWVSTVLLYGLTVAAQVVWSDQRIPLLS